MPNYQWKSSELYEHPAKHQAGTYGNIILSQAGVYALRVGGSTMSCPQEWASKIHADETEQSTMGRPKVGEHRLNVLAVDDQIKEGLEREAKKRGLSLPDARREAYRLFIGGE